jgi:hypothetical protein
MLSQVTIRFATASPRRRRHRHGTGPDFGQLRWHLVSSTISLDEATGRPQQLFILAVPDALHLRTLRGGGDVGDHLAQAPVRKKLAQFSPK